MDCVHFSHISPATHAMNENGLCFDWFTSFIFRGIFAVRASKATQNRKLKLILILRLNTCLSFFWQANRFVSKVWHRIPWKWAASWDCFDSFSRPLLFIFLLFLESSPKPKGLGSMSTPFVCKSHWPSVPFFANFNYVVVNKSGKLNETF